MDSPSLRAVLDANNTTQQGRHATAMWLVGTVTSVDRESGFCEFKTFLKFMNFYRISKMPTEFYIEIRYSNFD